MTASLLPTSKKRKREPPASDSPGKGSKVPAASNTHEARTVPVNTYTAGTATAVSASISSTASAAHITDGASLADALSSGISTTGPSKAAAAPPFPLEHYEATWAQMQAANYPLPAVSESDQKVLPSGFVAADKTGQAISVLCGASSLVDVGQDMLCCRALGFTNEHECSCRCQFLCHPK